MALYFLFPFWFYCYRFANRNDSIRLVAEALRARKARVRRRTTMPPMPSFLIDASFNLTVLFERS